MIKWLIKEEASIIMLSTGAIQVRYDGGTILNLECPFDDVTFLDKFGIVTAVPLAKAVGLGRDDLRRRLDYITNNISEIVTRLSRKEFFVCCSYYSDFAKCHLTGNHCQDVIVSIAISGMLTTKSYVMCLFV